MVTTGSEHAMTTTATGPWAGNERVDAPTGRPPAPAVSPDHPELPAGTAAWRDVAVGAVFEARAVTAAVAGGLHRAAANHARRMTELAERGSAERDRGRRRAVAAVEGTVTALASSPLVNLMVDAQVTRVLRPVVRTVLDEVLLVLEEEPERLQSLVQGQRDGMVDELVNRIRTGAAAGDTAVDRLTFRMFRRGPRPMPAPPDDL
jgi:hypothetical protein